MTAAVHFEDRSRGLPSPKELGLKTRIVVEGTAAADVGLRTLAASIVAATFAPFALSRRSMLEERKHLAFYADLVDAADPERSFPGPKGAIEMQARQVIGIPGTPDGGRIESLRFKSPFEAVNPAVRDRYAGHRRNATAHAQHWRHGEDGRPTLIVVHGFMGSPYWFNSAFFSLPWFYSKGWDVLLFTLPFHGGRRDRRREPYSGYGYFANGLAHVHEAMAQAMCDLRVLMDHLEGQGVEQMGITGLSLGGYTTALLASVEPRLAFAIPNSAVSETSSLIRGWFPAGQLIDLAMRARHVPREELDRAMASHSPLSYAPLVPKDRRFIIAGLGDRLAPPSQSEALWEHWDRCRLHWFPGNHVLHVNRGRYLREMGSFLRDIGMPIDDPPERVPTEP